MGGRREAFEAPRGRGVRGAAGALDREEKEQEGLIHALTGTLHHFFGGFASLVARVRDPRDPRKIVYPLASLVFAGVTMFLFQLRARRQVGLLLRNGPSAAKFQALFGVPSFPHGDTLDAAFSNLASDEVQAVVTGMTETLIRKKVLSAYRLLGI